MNKAAVLICEMENGGLTAIPEVSMVPLLEIRKKIQLTGMLDKKPVKSGMILASWKLMAQGRFTCETPEQKKARETKEAKSKADLEAKVKAEQEAKEKADAEAKAKAKAEAKAKKGKEE